MGWRLMYLHAKCVNHICVPSDNHLLYFKQNTKLCQNRFTVVKYRYYNRVTFQSVNKAIQFNQQTHCTTPSTPENFSKQTEKVTRGPPAKDQYLLWATRSTLRVGRASLLAPLVAPTQEADPFYIRLFFCSASGLTSFGDEWRLHQNGNVLCFAFYRRVIVV